MALLRIADSFRVHAADSRLVRHSTCAPPKHKQSKAAIHTRRPFTGRLPWPTTLQPGSTDCCRHVHTRRLLLFPAHQRTTGAAKASPYPCCCMHKHRRRQPSPQQRHRAPRSCDVDGRHLVPGQELIHKGHARDEDCQEAELALDGPPLENHGKQVEQDGCGKGNHGPHVHIGRHLQQ